MSGSSAKALAQEKERSAKYRRKYQAAKEAVDLAREENEKLRAEHMALQDEIATLKRDAVAHKRVEVQCERQQHTIETLQRQLADKRELQWENNFLKRQAAALAATISVPPQKKQRADPVPMPSKGAVLVSSTPTRAMSVEPMAIDSEEEYDTALPSKKHYVGRAGIDLTSSLPVLAWGEVEALVQRGATPLELEKLVRTHKPNRTPFRRPRNFVFTDARSEDIYNYHLNCDLFSGRIDTVKWLLANFDFEVEDLFRVHYEFDPTDPKGRGYVAGPTNAIGPVMRMILKRKQIDDAHANVFVELMEKVKVSSSLTKKTVQVALKTASQYQPPKIFEKIIQAFKHIDNEIPDKPIATILYYVHEAKLPAGDRNPQSDFYDENLSLIAVTSLSIRYRLADYSK